MLTLVCHETGLNCDYIIKGETDGDKKNGAQAHGVNADDIHVNRIPANFLCQTIWYFWTNMITKAN